MKRALLFLTLILLIPFLNSNKVPGNGDKPYAEGQVMVKLFSDQPQNQQQMLQEILDDFQSVGLTSVARLSDRLNIFLLEFNPSLVNDEQLLDDIKAHPFVELAQFNHFVELRAFYPNDNFFSLQWNLHNTGQSGGVTDADVDCPEGWDLGASGVTATGDTIIVAILDNGFDIDHEDISYWKNYHDIPNNWIDDDTNGYIDDYDGWNSFNNSGQIIENDHGTHVTGIAAAHGNNSLGVSGVNLNVKVMPVVAHGPSIIESSVVAGYAYVHEMRTLYNTTGGQKGAFIVSTNCSFGVNNGQPEDYPIWGAMYDSLGMQGVLSAGATANANLNIDVVGDIPTAFTSDFLITVTNTDDDDVKSPYAAFGQTTIDLGAPGTSVYSTRMSNAYGYKTGTSMASPHVAGAVAFMFSAADSNFMEAYHNDPAGMALVIKQYILNGTDPLPSLEGITVTGGRLNIYNAAKQMLDPEIIFDPMSILQVMMQDKQDSVTLSFTNNSNIAIDYSITYPAPLEWLSLTGPVSGSLVAYGTGSIKLHFDTEGQPVDSLFTLLSFNYGNDELFQVPVNLYIDPFVLVAENKDLTGEPAIMELWPNPAKEVLNFKFLGLSSDSDYKMEIYDGAGKKIDEKNIPGNQSNYQLNVEAYNKGMYIAVMKHSSNALTTKKFLVLK